METIVNASNVGGHIMPDGIQHENQARNSQAMLMAAEGGGGPTQKLMVPHVGMSTAEFLVQPAMMNNAQLVDDKNNTTASQMNAPALMQATPARYKIDIWSALFTSNLECQRIPLGGQTGIGYKIFDYSSDVNSPNFPNFSYILTFIKLLLAGHAYYVSDFIIKIKLISAAGTIGRIIVGVLPEEYELSPDNAVASLKASGYDYIEIGADGNSTHTLSMRPYTNMGFANSTSANGAGAIVENVRVVAFVSETFRTTFSEQPPDITVTTEFSFGEAFEMTIPKTTLPDLINAVVQPQRETIRQTVDRAYIGRNLILRVGSNRFGSLAPYASFGNRAELPELTQFDGVVLGPNDCILQMPALGVNATGSVGVFCRGNLPAYLDGTVPDTNDTMFQYLARELVKSGEVEVYPLLMPDGSETLELNFYTGDVAEQYRAAYVQEGYTINEAYNYVWRGLVVRSIDNYALLAWPDSETAMQWNGAWSILGNEGLLITPLPGTIDLRTPLFFPTLDYSATTIFTSTVNSEYGQVQHVAAGAPQVFTLGAAVGANVTDHTYKSLTISELPFATKTTTGTGAVPSKDAMQRLLKLLPGNGVTFDLVDSGGLLVARCAYNDNDGILINIDQKFIYREIGGPLYANNIRNSNGELAPTSSDAWNPYNTLTLRKKLAARKLYSPQIPHELQSYNSNSPHQFQSFLAGMGMNILGGALGGIGAGIQQNNQFEQQQKLSKQEYQQQLALQNAMFNNNYDMATHQGQIANSNALGLSAQNFQQNMLAQKQQQRNGYIANGLADPSAAGKLTGDRFYQPRNQVNTPSRNYNSGPALFSVGGKKQMGSSKRGIPQQNRLPYGTHPANSGAMRSAMQLGRDSSLQSSVATFEQPSVVSQC